MSNWAGLLTEQRNPDSEHLDEVSTVEMLAIINREDAKIAPAVARELPSIARAVEMAAAAFLADGRLFYLGAGTSGRLGVLDASECPPTYGTDPEMVQGLIAGGSEAVFRAVEGAEDRRDSAAADLRERRLGDRDVVVGIAASGVTPYVLGGLECGRRCGCGTVFVTCSPTAAAAAEADIKIVVEVGPEVVTGSTRMKAGTATKLVLNMISTGAMVKLGKTFGNLMVDLQPRNAKLRDRSVRILTTLAGLEPEAARKGLALAGGELKLALVMAMSGLDLQTARLRLATHRGIVKHALRGDPATVREA
jgi:N-acetylmuramic acid 6-phosphate etherase